MVRTIHEPYIIELPDFPGYSASPTVRAKEAEAALEVLLASSPPPSRGEEVPVLPTPRPFLGPCPEVCPFSPDALQAQFEAVREAQGRNDGHLRMALQRRASSRCSRAVSCGWKNRLGLRLPARGGRNSSQMYTSGTAESSGRWQASEASNSAARAGKLRISTCSDDGFVQLNRDRANAWISGCLPPSVELGKVDLSRRQMWYQHKVAANSWNQERNRMLRNMPDTPFDWWFETKQGNAATGRPYKRPYGDRRKGSVTAKATPLRPKSVESHQPPPQQQQLPQQLLQQQQDQQ